MMGYTSNKYSKKITDDELWNLDYVLSEFILPRIKKLRTGTGKDQCLLGEGAQFTMDNPTDEEWKLAFDKAEQESDKIYDQIERGLELNIQNNTKSLTAEERKEMEKGLELLGKYYSSLWS